MKYPYLAIFICVGMLFGLSTYSHAENITTYKSDPVFAPINEDDKHPLQGLFDMAHEGDARAQYILGDLFSKGKGGVGKDIEKARLLFNHSAKNGNAQAFIRLAALEKNQENLKDAYKWYHLSIDYQKRRDLKNWSKRALKDLLENDELTSEDKKSARMDVKEWKKSDLAALSLGKPETHFPTPRPEDFEKTAMNDKNLVTNELKKESLND
jgi:hypothetical protein